MLWDYTKDGLLKELTFFFSPWPRRGACGILVPGPGIEPVSPAVEAQTPNHWTAREFPQGTNFLLSPCCVC